MKTMLSATKYYVPPNISLSNLAGLLFSPPPLLAFPPSFLSIYLSFLSFWCVFVFFLHVSPYTMYMSDHRGQRGHWIIWIRATV